MRITSNGTRERDLKWGVVTYNASYTDDFALRA
jgi:hypothetical protein